MGSWHLRRGPLELLLIGSMRKCNTWGSGQEAGTLSVHGEKIEASESLGDGQDIRGAQRSSNRRL